MSTPAPARQPQPRTASADTDADTAAGPVVAALGGGHGLFASLSALRRLTRHLTAVVTVADDGGSSGRLREEFGVLPPGDLRMALAALCGDDEWGRTWSRVAQHRFRSEGDLHGHAVGNLLIVALWELLEDAVEGLDWVAQLLGAQGRVLPMAAVPLDITAQVLGLDPRDSLGLTEVSGQVAVATTPGRVVTIGLDPVDPPACPQAVAAVLAADWVVLGPGSWFTSVLPHLLVPELAEALVTTEARRLVTLNLEAQSGETAGFSPETHLEVLSAHAPQLRVDAVLADPTTVGDLDGLGRVCSGLGAELVIAPVARGDGTANHDPDLLAAAYDAIFADGKRSKSWR